MDVAIVRRDLESLVGDGKDVILVMHSYGGMAGGGAIEGLEVGRSPGAKGGVKAAVFLAAFLTPKGKSLLGMFTGGNPPYLEPHVSCFPCRSSHPIKARLPDSVGFAVKSMPH